MFLYRLYHPYSTLCSRPDVRPGVNYVFILTLPSLFYKGHQLARTYEMVLCFYIDSSISILQGAPAPTYVGAGTMFLYRLFHPYSTRGIRYVSYRTLCFYIDSSIPILQKLIFFLESNHTTIHQEPVYPATALLLLSIYNGLPCYYRRIRQRSH